ncbi:MAG: acyl-CoA dehydrogenase family protein [Myxococcota bacterium]|nr:acyl-CoA dehydrogenase family protein [Myxococcota bacterium]
MTATPQPDLEGARTLVAAGQALFDKALARAKEITENGGGIDDHQVLTERVAYTATEIRAANEVLDNADAVVAEGRSSDSLERLWSTSAAELVASVRDRIAPSVDELGIGEEALDETFPASLRKLLRSATDESVFRAIGRHVADTAGRNDTPLDEMHEQVRDQVRDFALNEVLPEAEHIHRSDDIVPEKFIEKMAELGFFGLSVPEEYGGVEMGNLAMILTTEELSRASLAAAGSLITRPEILSKALMGGGTEAQKRHWLPKLASGEVMVGISVTEPDIGSDVASVKCRAEKASVDGREGWVINGPKAWCTFAGRADVLAVLVRTNPDPAAGARGLSLLIVPKDPDTSHSFETVQAGGGRVVGKADATPGYRGMHSFTLNFENYFVPAENLVGGESGEGRGFYLQMAGFGAGRLQTSGRACGVAQAALEETAKYVVDRKQFDQPLADFQLTQYTLGRMATKLAGARAISYRAAREFDDDERRANTIASQAKLLACDVAVEVTQQGQLLHGGWGYAEEYPISRYVVDAQVLPIFEGVKAILELKVIGRSLLG